MSSGGYFYKSQTAEGARKGGDREASGNMQRKKERKTRVRNIRNAVVRKTDISKRVIVNVNKAGKVVV